MDAYIPQLERAPEYLSKKLGDIRDIPIGTGSLDAVVIKLGLHELPLCDQQKAVKEIHRVLKPGGRFINWMSYFSGKRNQEVYQWFVREKDRIAGFTDLVKNRYFPTIGETISYLQAADFEDIKISYKNKDFCQTRGWFYGDFCGDIEKLEDFHSSIRSRWKDIVEVLGAEDRGDNIKVGFPICFVEAHKPRGESKNYLLDAHTKTNVKIERGING